MVSQFVSEVHLAAWNSVSFARISPGVKGDLFSVPRLYFL